MNKQFFFEIIDLKNTVFEMNKEEYNDFQKYVLDQIRLLAKKNNVELSEIDEILLLSFVIAGKKSSLNNVEFKNTDKEEVIYDIQNIIQNLNKDGLRIADYNDAVRNNHDCALAAVQNDYLAYYQIGDSLKQSPDIIDAFYLGYIKKQEEDLDTSMADYYPRFAHFNMSPDEIVDSITRSKNKGE